jgi:hypothetical protein
MLQGRYSARGGQIKGRTATLMFCRNNRKNISGTSYHDFLEKEIFSRLSQRLGDEKFLT